MNYYSERERDHAEEVVAAIGEAGATAIAVQADLGDEQQLREMVERAVREFGRLDTLVNNAGIEKQLPLVEMGLEDWSAVIRTNLTGAFLCLREAGRKIVAAGGGVIVNMSRVHEFIPWPGFAHYCAEDSAAATYVR